VTQKFFRVSSRDSRKILKFVSKTHITFARARGATGVRESKERVKRVKI
jgi:hypothetical protein